MTQIVALKRKQQKPVVVAEEAPRPHGIVWQEIGGAQYDEPTFDLDPVLDAVAFQKWQQELIDDIE